MAAIKRADVFKGVNPAAEKLKAKAAAVKAWDDYAASVDKDRQYLKSKGMTVTPCSAEDQQKIIDMIKPLTDKLYKEQAWAKPLTDKIRAVK